MTSASLPLPRSKGPTARTEVTTALVLGLSVGAHLGVWLALPLLGHGLDSDRQPDPNLIALDFIEAADPPSNEVEPEVPAPPSEPEPEPVTRPRITPRTVPPVPTPEVPPSPPATTTTASELIADALPEAPEPEGGANLPEGGRDFQTRGRAGSAPGNGLGQGGRIGGSAVGPVGDERAEAIAWMARVNRTIMERALRSYPRAAIRTELEGTVVIAISVTPDGAVRLVHVQTSSGHGILDEAAIAAVNAVGTLPPPPESFNRRGRPLTMPIHYRLH